MAQARIDLAAYGRDEGDDRVVEAEAQRRAELAVAKAEGVLRFVQHSEDPLADELRALYAAVAPIIGRP